MISAAVRSLDSCVGLRRNHFKISGDPAFVAVGRNEQRAIRGVNRTLLGHRLATQDPQAGKIVLYLLECLQHRLPVVGDVLLVNIAGLFGEGMTTAGIE